MFPAAKYFANITGSWPTIFYVSGVFALLVWALIWSLIGTNSPEELRDISEEER